MSDVPLRFSLVLGQRLPWPIMQANALAAEAFGFDSLYLVDHLLGRLDVNEPTHEGYTMLGAIAADTSRIRLGLMVAGNTYRNPVLLLKQAMTVDHISRGRIDFGVGAGWAEREHEAYAFPFPAAGERVDRFAEALAIWRDLQTNERTTYSGRYYDIVDAPFEPKSIQGKMPVLIGGSKPRMLRLVAEYADIWNTTVSADEAEVANQQLDQLCAEIGRDPGAIERSVSPDINLLESVEAFREGVDRYHAAGFTHITLPWPRVDAEIPVLQEVAALHLQEYRDNPPAPDPVEQAGELASTEHGLHEYGFPANRSQSWVYTKDVISSHPEGRLISYLIRRAGETVAALDLQREFGFATHRAVSMAFATLGSALDEANLTRPWTEGPRGWSIDVESGRNLS